MGVHAQPTCTNPLYSGPLRLLGNRELQRATTATQIGNFPACPSRSNQLSCCSPDDFASQMSVFFGTFDESWNQSLQNFTSFNLQTWLQQIETTFKIQPGSTLEQHIIQLVKISQQVYYPQMQCTSAVTGYLGGMMCSSCDTDQDSMNWFLWGNDTLLLSPSTCDSIWSSCSTYIDTLSDSIMQYLQLELQIAQALDLERVVAHLLEIMKTLSDNSLCSLGLFSCVVRCPHPPSLSLSLDMTVPGIDDCKVLLCSYVLEGVSTDRLEQFEVLPLVSETIAQILVNTTAAAYLPKSRHPISVAAASLAALPHRFFQSSDLLEILGFSSILDSATADDDNDSYDGTATNVYVSHDPTALNPMIDGCVRQLSHVSCTNPTPSSNSSWWTPTTIAVVTVCSIIGAAVIGIALWAIFFRQRSERKQRLGLILAPQQQTQQQSLRGSSSFTQFSISNPLIPRTDSMSTFYSSDHYTALPADRDHSINRLT